MNLYDLDTFLMYYTNSWIRNPETGVPCQVRGRSNTDGHILVSTTAGVGTAIPKDMLDWPHVRTPLLGYRNSRELGSAVYIERHAGRHTVKGLHQNTVSLIVHDEMRTACEEVRGAPLPGTMRLDTSMVDEIFDPKTMKVAEAIEILTGENQVSSLALNPDWAICLGSLEGYEFLLFMRGIVVASSSDGTAWEWAFDEAKFAFEEYNNAL